MSRGNNYVQGECPDIPSYQGQHSLAIPRRVGTVPAPAKAERWAECNTLCRYPWCHSANWYHCRHGQKRIFTFLYPLLYTIRPHTAFPRRGGIYCGNGDGRHSVGSGRTLPLSTFLSASFLMRLFEHTSESAHQLCGAYARRTPIAEVPLCDHRHRWWCQRAALCMYASAGWADHCSAASDSSSSSSISISVIAAYRL